MKFVFAGIFFVVLQYIFPGKFGDGSSFVGLVISAGGMLYISKFARCPECKAPFASDQVYGSAGFGPVTQYRINYCPSCGVDMNTWHEF